MVSKCAIVQDKVHHMILKYDCNDRYLTNIVSEGFIFVQYWDNDLVAPINSNLIWLIICCKYYFYEVLLSGAVGHAC